MYNSVNRIIGLTLHYLYSVRRNPARVIEIFFWPALELILFVFLAQGLREGSFGTMAGVGIAAGVIFWILTARVVQETVAQFTDDYFSRNIQNLLVAPVNLVDLSVSLLLGSLIKLIPSYAVLLFILSLLQQHQLLSLFSAGFLWVVLLVLFGGALALFGLSFVLLFGERVSFIGWIISTLVQVVSAVYYSRSVLPTPLYELSYAIPSSYIFESIREYVASGEQADAPLVVSAAISVAYYACAFIFLRFSFHYARKKGIFVKT